MLGSVCGRSLNSAISLFVASLLILGQWSEVYAGENAKGTGQAGNPTKLTIVIVGGDEPINNIRERVAREMIVQVDDENHRPVGGALVLFRLPTSGAGGSFANGTNVMSITTDATGRATAAFTPNTVTGSFRVSINASFQGQTATASISQRNEKQSRADEGISAKKIALIAAAAAGVAAIGIVAKQKGGGNVPATGSAPTVHIGTGTPTLGAPGGWAESSKQSSPRPKWRD